MIGVFVLTMVVGVFAFIIWATKVDIATEFAFYDIYFEESVAGLSVGGDVSYRGFIVGEVRDISLDPDDPSRVRVTIRIAGDTPVREDAVASLEFQGLTGLSVVQISGGSVEALPLTVKPGETYAVIESTQSQIQALFTGAPNLINSVTVLARQLAGFFDEDNRQAVANILAHAEEISGGLAERTDQLQSIIENVDKTLTELQQAAASVNTLAGTATEVVDQDMRALVADLREVSQSIRDLTQSLDVAVQDNGKALSAFTSNTLPEVALFVQEARRMASAISRIAEQLEKSPSEFLFSGGKPEYEPQ